jgi:protein disulfide-isomerase
MKVTTIWTVVSIFLPFLVDAVAAGAAGGKEDPGGSVEMPPKLSEEEFKKITSEQLTFVEFFSPFCHHCKDLYPTWEKTYKEFYPELKKYNMQMRQVDCVERGDLCASENVYSYPNLRLYGPSSNKKTKFLGSYPRMLPRTVEKFKNFLRESYAEFSTTDVDLPSMSKVLDASQLVKLVAGESKEAWFVTFFPASNEQWEKTDSTGKNHFPENCLDCHDYKVVWDKVSSQIQATFNTGHVNCFDNPNFCEKLGFKDLTIKGGYPEPKFVYFLPKSARQTRMDYKGDIDATSMKHHAHRLFDNFQYEKVTSAGLPDLFDFRPGLHHKPLELEFPLQNKVVIIFFYDQDSSSKEDWDILSYILEYITNSPFKIRLYTSKHKKIEGDIREQAENMIKFINYEEGTKYEFDEEMYLSYSLTSKPTLLIMRDNALFTNVFQQFAPEDIRDAKKVLEFIGKNQYPLYQELTPKLLPSYFNKEESHKDEKVVITFIDSSDEKQTQQAMYNISLAAHEYYFIQKKYYFNDILTQRQLKADSVAKLKKKGADSVAVIQKMREEIPHFFDRDGVLFTYIDLKARAQFDRVSGWKFNANTYKPGDTIVVSKDYKQYWDEDILGAKLVNDPTKLKGVLASLLDPNLIKGGKVNVKLVGSPYGGPFKFMNIIHQRGFLGYVGFIGMIYIVQLFIRKVAMKSRKNRSTQRGIIGNIPKKD